MVSCQGVICDIEKEAAKTYAADITGLAEAQSKNKKAKVGFITINKKLTAIPLWHDNTVRTERLNQADKWYKRLAISRKAMAIAAVAAIILMAVSITAAPLIGAGLASFMGYTAAATGIGFLGLLITSLFFNYKFRKIALPFGHQHISQAQGVYTANVNEKWPPRKKKIYANEISKQFQKFSHLKISKAKKACKVAANKLNSK